MKKKFFIVGFLCFMLGIVLNLWHEKSIQANQPGLWVPITTHPISMVFDEDWTAVQAYVSGPNGYDLINPSLASSSPTQKAASVTEETVAGEQVAVIETYPEMIVTRWEIKGHIHYQ